MPSSDIYFVVVERQWTALLPFYFKADFCLVMYQIWNVCDHAARASRQKVRLAAAGRDTMSHRGRQLCGLVN